MKAYAVAICEHTAAHEVCLRCTEACACKLKVGVLACVSILLHGILNCVFICTYIVCASILGFKHDGVIVTLLHKARKSYRVAMCRNLCFKLTVFNLG